MHLFILAQQYPESIIYNLDLLNLTTCKIYITPTPFFDTTIITYEIELSPSGKKIGFNLLDEEYFTIPYVLDKTQIHQPFIKFQHRQIKGCGSLLPMDKIRSHLKVHLMK